MPKRIFEERKFNIHGKVLSCDEFFPLGKKDYRPTRENTELLIAYAEELLKKEIPFMTAVEYAMFQKNGNRTVYEEKYRLRREMCLILALAESLEKKGRFTEQLVNVIWTILEETTWVLPAHLNNPAINAKISKRDILPYCYNGAVDYIDLYAGATGAALAVALYFAGDILDDFCPTISERVRFELDRRILTPFLDKSTWRNAGWPGWDGTHREILDRFLAQGIIDPEMPLLCNNWAPWIMGNILTVTAFCERNDDRREKIVSESMMILDNFIMGYGEDGACDEGPSYWAVAPGALCNACALLSDMTNGYVNIFDDPLIRRMGESQALISVNRDRFLTYSDTPANVKNDIRLLGRYADRCHSPLLQSFVADRVSNQLELSEKHERLRVVRRNIPYDWLGDLAWEPSSSSSVRYQPPCRVYFENFGLFIAREYADETRGLYLAVKGGHNDASHNHNDVGSFVVYTDGKPMFLDAGTGTYTAKTFSADRYTIWNMRSDHHNLPTINGHDQKFGRKYRATEIQATRDSYSMELREAYGEEAGILSYRRTAGLYGDRIEIADCISLKNAGTVDFHLLTDAKPENLSERSFTLHGKTVTYPSGLSLRVEEVEHTSPETRTIPTMWGVDTLYLLTLTSPESDTHHFVLTVS